MAMKNKITIFLLVLSALTAVSFYSCSTTDDDLSVTRSVSYDLLPAAAKHFIQLYYPDTSIANVNRSDIDGIIIYEVSLDNGQVVDFNSVGDWTEVKAPADEGIPNGIVLKLIAEYLDTNYRGYPINDVVNTGDGYRVTLTTGVVLHFDAIGGIVVS